MRQARRHVHAPRQPVPGQHAPSHPAPSHPAPSDDDAAIIERSWREAEQFAAIFDKYAPRIHRYVTRRAGYGVADDLTAETFLAAFARRRRYDVAYRDAGPWLYGIATNLIGTHRRDELRQLRIRQAAFAEVLVPGHAEQVAANVTASGVRDVLAAALAELAGGDRDVVVLIAWEQLTYEETARALDIPVGTVRSRLNRARGQLRLALAQTGHRGTFEEILTNE